MTGSDAAAGAAGTEMSFEDALRRLEEVVGELERGGQTLNEALGLFEEGIRLSRTLTAKLDAAEARIDRIVETASGAMRLEPFENDEDGGLER